MGGGWWSTVPRVAVSALFLGQLPFGYQGRLQKPVIPGAVPVLFRDSYFNSQIFRGTKKRNFLILVYSANLPWTAGEKLAALSVSVSGRVCVACTVCVCVACGVCTACVAW